MDHPHAYYRQLKYKIPTTVKHPITGLDQSCQFVIESLCVIVREVNSLAIYKRTMDAYLSFATTPNIWIKDRRSPLYLQRYSIFNANEMSRNTQSGMFGI